MRTVVLSLLAVTLSLAAPSAQQTQRSIGAAGAPTIVVDFAAVDAKGLPVSDLTPADLTVRVDGKPRAVKDLQLVKREAPGAAAAAVADPLPAPFGSNVASGNSGRAAFLIVDNETITTGLEQRVRDGLVTFINSLGPKDLASIVTVPHGGMSVDLTTDRAKLKDAAAKITGARSSSETANDVACRSKLTVQQMVGILQQRADADTPTDVIFVSSSLSGARNNVTSGDTALGHGLVGGCDLAQEEFTKLGTAAASARARIYIVQPESLPVEAGSSADFHLVGLEGVASLTGGYIWHMAGSDEPGFQRIATETSAYYSATIEVDPGEMGTALKPLSIKTSRADVTLRARPSVTMPKAAATGPAKAAISPKDMLRTATVYRDVPLRVQAFSSRNPGDTKIKVVAIAEAGVRGTKLSAAAIGLYDTAGKLVGQWSADAAALTAPALVAAFVQSPGTYRVRVAATDAAGRSGAADVAVDVGLTPAASGLSLSSILIGTTDGGFAPKLQFTNEPAATAYFELYGGKQGMPVSISLELASTLNGPALTAIQPKIVGSQEPDKYLITAPINLAALPPGDYVVRAIVGLDGFPATRIVRTLRKVQ